MSSPSVLGELSCSQRNVVLIVGATGALGTPLVAELRRRGTPLRLLGRSRESFLQSGFLNDNDAEMTERLDLVVCEDVTDRNAWSDDWFKDVKIVLCVARPRAMKAGEHEAYAAMIRNLTDMVCNNNVPRLMIHGLPYVREYVLGEPAGVLMDQQSLKLARERVNHSTCSNLTISHMSADMSGIGSLLRLARTTRIWLCAWGRDPKMQPVSERDYATAVASFADSNDTKPELLVGGPQVLTWRELGKSISNAIGKQLFVISLPLFVFKVLIGVIGIAKRLLPFMERIEYILKVVAVPMISDLTNDEFVHVGSDTVDAHLRSSAAVEETAYVHKIVGGSGKKID